MIAIERSAGAIDAATSARDVVPELLGRHLQVVRVAQVAGVAILVAAAMCQRLDVIDDGGLDRALLGEAHLA